MKDKTQTFDPYAGSITVTDGTLVRFITPEGIEFHVQFARMFHNSQVDWAEEDNALEVRATGKGRSRRVNITPAASNVIYVEAK